MVTKVIDLTSQEADLSARPATGTAAELLTEDARESITHEDGVYIDGVLVPESNQNPHRRRIADPVRGLKKLVRMVNNYFVPPPTAEEIAKMDEKKRLKLLDKTLRAEAATAGRRMSRALSDLGFAYHRKDPSGNITRSRYIQFDHVYSTEDAHWFHVDMRHWPHGVNSDDIIQQTVINHLSRSVGHKVNIRATPEGGVWYIIERASGMMGIPIHVPISDMWARFNTTASNLTIPIGMTNNRKVVFDDIDDMVHIMVAGQTGGGKSTFLNSMICTLVTRNTPDQLRLLLMDMKAGLEFQYYENLPHLLPIVTPDKNGEEKIITATGIINDPDYVAPALHWIVNHEAKSRLDKIRAAGHKDIKSYNVHNRKNKLARLLVIVDEWAIARMGAGGKDSEIELAKGLQLLRAAGIHFVICTQTPSKDVLGVLARANLTTRLAFSCVDASASMLIVGDWSAMNLSPAGRCIYKRGHNQPIQTPWISEERVKEIVSEVIGGKFTEVKKSHDVTQNEMLLWALHENAGSLRWQELFKQFNHRGITQIEVKNILQAIENKTVDLNGHLYTIQPGLGSRPRKLIAADESEEISNETSN